MTRADILDAAKACITVDRAATHGDAEDSFAWIAGHWNWWLQDKLMPGASITPYDVAQMMVGFKQARAKGNPAHGDNFTDGCGYFALAGEIVLRATERAAEGALGVSVTKGTRQPVPGVWAPNSYSALHAALIGPVTDDGALFPSGWTPETEDERLNKIADERASGPFVSVSLDDLTREGN